MGNPDATLILSQLRRGDGSAAARLLPLVYDQLRDLAGSYFRRQRPDHTLQPTALVHEAFLRLVNQKEAAWQDRAHFLATCAVAMRSILADHARQRAAAKRGGGWRRVTLSGVGVSGEETEAAINALDLEEALSELEALDARQVRIAEHRLFGGLTVEEIAYTLGVSRTTVENDWYMARAWLSGRLKDSGGGSTG